MIRRHINFYKKMHKFSHLCTKIHCDKTGFAQKFTAFAQIFTPKCTKIHCIYLLYMLFIRLNVGRASYRNVNSQYQVDSKFFSPLSKFYVGMSKIYVGSINFFSRSNQKFMWVQSNFYTNFILLFYLAVMQANQGTLLRRHNPYIRTHPSLRSGAVRTTCYAVARIGLEKKERGSCNSHPSFYSLITSIVLAQIMPSTPKFARLSE